MYSTFSRCTNGLLFFWIILVTHQPDLQPLSALDMDLVMASCLTQFLREPASIRQRKNWAEYVSGLSEVEFRRTFRMSWPDWEVLLHHFSGRLDKSSKRKFKNDFVIPCDDYSIPCWWCTPGYLWALWRRVFHFL